jgi:hypothetical protein
LRQEEQQEEVVVAVVLLMRLALLRYSRRLYWLVQARRYHPWAVLYMPFLM